MPIRFALLALISLPLSAQDVFNSNSSEGPCLAARQREGELYAANMAALQKKEKALEEQSQKERAACGYNSACQDRAIRDGQERSRRLELEKLDENSRHEKKRLELDSSRTCQPAPQGLPPCERALSDEDWRYGQAMLELQKKEIDDRNKNDHALSDCRGDGRCRDDVAKRAVEMGRALETQRDAENAKHKKLRADIERTVCGNKSISRSNDPGPPQSQPGPDAQIILKTIELCFEEKGHLDYYRPPVVIPYTGKATYVKPSVFYDPVFLNQQTPYTRAFWLASAYIAHVATLERERYGTPKTLAELQMRVDYLNGWLSNCLVFRGVLPTYGNNSPQDPRIQYADFVGVSLDNDRVTEFQSGWVYEAGLPLYITHH